jgi:hypothetical protein
MVGSVLKRFLWNQSDSQKNSSEERFMERKEGMIHRYLFLRAPPPPYEKTFRGWRYKMVGIRNVLKATLSAVAVASTIALIGCVNPVAVPKSPTTEKPAVAVETAPLVGTIVDNPDGTYSIEFPLPPSSGGSASFVDGRSLVNYEDATALQQAVNYYQLVLVDDAEPGKIWASTSVTNNTPGAAQVFERGSKAGRDLSLTAPAWA